MGWWVVIDYLLKSFDIGIVLPYVKVIFTSTYFSCSIVKLRCI